MSEGGETTQSSEALLSAEEILLVQAGILRELRVSLRQQRNAQIGLTFSALGIGLSQMQFDRESWKYTFRRNETPEGVEITFGREPKIVEIHNSGFRSGTKGLSLKPEILQEIRMAQSTIGKDPVIEYYSLIRGEEPQRFLNTQEARSKSMELAQSFRFKNLRDQSDAI